MLATGYFAAFDLAESEDNLPAAVMAISLVLGGALLSLGVVGGHRLHRTLSRDTLRDTRQQPVTATAAGSERGSVEQPQPTVEGAGAGGGRGGTAVAEGVPPRAEPRRPATE